MNDDKKISHYAVIKSGEGCCGMEWMSQEANKLIEQGYQPYYGPQIKQPPGSHVIQAFVKYVEEEKLKGMGEAVPPKEGK